MNSKVTYEMSDFISEFGCALVLLRVVQGEMSENNLSMKSAAEAVYASVQHLERICIDMENLNESQIQEGRL